MIVDVSAINKLMDYWGEDRICIFNDTETTLLNLRNYFENNNLNIPLEKCKFSFFEVEYGDDLLIIPNHDIKNRDDLIISTRENIDLDV